MELLLALIYVSFCVAIFKIFRIPVNQWSLSTAVLGGIIGISLTPSGHELQSSVHSQRPNLFCSDPNIADRKGARS